MTDLPEGFEGYICDKYKMNPTTFKLLYENKYNSDLAAYTAGMAQGRREQAAENADLAGKWFMPIIDDDICVKAGIALSNAIRRAAGEQDD